MEWRHAAAVAVLETRAAPHGRARKLGWPVDEPHGEERHRQGLPLSRPGSAPRPRPGLRDRLQLRQAPQGATLANPVPGHLRCLAGRPVRLQDRPTPPHPGTKQIQAGKLQAIGISSPERLPSVDIPTFKEQGVDVTLANWRGLMAPTKMRPADLKTFDAAMGRWFAPTSGGPCSKSVAGSACTSRRKNLPHSSRRSARGSKASCGMSD